VSSQTDKDNSPDSLKRIPWRDWLLVGWAAGVFAFFLRCMIEILS